jgi:hypothetical protein
MTGNSGARSGGQENKRGEYDLFARSLFTDTARVSDGGGMANVSPLGA